MMAKPLKEFRAKGLIHLNQVWQNKKITKTRKIYARQLIKILNVEIYTPF